MTDNTTLSASESIERLRQQLGDTADYWKLFLQNNRRQDRTPEWPIPFTVIQGRPRYQAADIDAFIDHHKGEALRRGRVAGRAEEMLRVFGGSTTGRPFDAQITPQIEDGTGIGFIQMIVASPLAVFRLDSDQAQSLASELLEAAAVLDRATRAPTP